MSVLDHLDPFDLLDTEAARLDRYFTHLAGPDWDHASRCAGWSVRDVLGHLAGEELYNHACLDGDLAGFSAYLEKEGVTSLDGFNDWCVRQRRGLPVADVLDEWRERNGETRRRHRALGAGATLDTLAGPYPVGAQTLHYASELATHADDVGVPVEEGEEPHRTDWRARFGLFALEEGDSPLEVEEVGGGFRVSLPGGPHAELSAADFVDATNRRLGAEHTLAPELRAALAALA